MGNPVSRGQQRDKPFRDALRLEMTAAANGEECAAPMGSLRWIARKMLERSGEETAAAREVADRLDGKVPQAIVGDSEHDPLRVYGGLDNDELDKRIAQTVAQLGYEASGVGGAGGAPGGATEAD